MNPRTQTLRRDSANLVNRADPLGCLSHSHVERAFQTLTSPVLPRVSWAGRGFCFTLGLARGRWSAFSSRSASSACSGVGGWFSRSDSPLVGTAEAFH